LTSANASIESAEDIARLASVLNHPLRIRLLLALAASGLGSATVLSIQLGDVSVGDCHYHLTTLEDGGFIKLARSRSVRGATERVYRLAPWDLATKRLRDFIDVAMPATISAGSAPAVATAANRRSGA
jgi:DNA-binding transcriptional ArsR family regulator